MNLVTSRRLRHMAILLVATGPGLAGCGDSTSGANAEAGADPGVRDDAGVSGKGPSDADLGSDTDRPAQSPDGAASADAAGPPPGTPLRFVVFGDSRDNPTVHQSVVDAIAAKAPQLILDTGDLWAGYPSGSSQWKTITTKNATVADLLSKNLYLVSRGNHESVSELLAFQPSLVRGNKETYSFTFGSGFFVSLGMDPAAATAFLEAELKTPAAQAAKWRMVYSHYPIYSGGPHGGTGDAAIEKLCDTYHVAVYFNGHDHTYERSHQMFGQKIADKGDALSLAKGTVYVVSGGGGAPFYAVTPIASTHTYKTNKNHFVLVTANDAKLTVEALDTTGATLDTFSVAQ